MSLPEISLERISIPGPNGKPLYEGQIITGTGQKHGFGVYFYENGSKLYEGQWEHDRKEGLP